jgi:hypothetical protein
MKLFKKLGLVLALGASLALVGCGGDNPNESTSASNNPTCRSTANWAKISKGLTESKVLSILGNASQISSTSNSKTFIYESCRGFLVQTTPDDPATLVNEQVTKIEVFGGSVVFNAAQGGTVSTFASPANSTTSVIRELGPNEF